MHLTVGPQNFQNHPFVLFIDTELILKYLNNSMWVNASIKVNKAILATISFTSNGSFSMHITFVGQGQNLLNKHQTP